MEYIYSAIASLVVAVLAFALQQKIKQINELKAEKEKLENEKESAVMNGVLALLRVKLIEYHKRYTDEGEISTYGFENWTLMFDAYQNLGGNGMVKKMDEEIKEMHFK